MDGVFINLTADDINVTIDNNQIITIQANPDLMTPTRQIVLTEVNTHAIVSTPLKEDDFRYLQGTNWVNTVYNKITRSEEEIKIKTLLYNPYVKYIFTKEQIEKINKISNRRTRLFITSKEDALYWSDGKFECPFRNYRLFAFEKGILVEYPIPKTYLDLVVDSVKIIGGKLGTN